MLISKIFLYVLAVSPVSDVQIIEYLLYKEI